MRKTLLRTEENSNLRQVLLLKNFLFETRRRLKSTDNGVGLMAEMVKHSQPRGFFFSGGG
jgi:hypothetical protein